MQPVVYTNVQIESVTLTGSQAACNTFEVRVSLKSGTFNTHRMSGGEIRREYGAYLTAEDRARLAKGKGKEHKHHQHWRCCVM
jgi:hypothetical protein